MQTAKPLEHRSALTPHTAKALIDVGYKVNVERTTPGNRIFKDEEFEAVGATLAPTNSWREAPADHIIIGLKELPEDTCKLPPPILFSTGVLTVCSPPENVTNALQVPLVHTHIQFAHCYKEQGGWADVLSRFPAGNGTLLDLEFLTDERGVRVAAFGFHAGYAGTALALENWAHQLTDNAPMGSVTHYEKDEDLIEDIEEKIAKGEKKVGRKPRVIIIGAKGRCGAGAVKMCKDAKLPDENITQWDMDETAKGGPFKEILEHDIFVNCIYLNKKIPNFVDMESLNTPGRNLTVVCDVSADTTNPNNPVPIYTIATTFDKPTVPVDVAQGPKLSVISIDHLPSLLPREASESFSNLLLPHLLQLKDRQSDPVWQRAEKLFQEKVATLPKN